MLNVSPCFIISNRRNPYDLMYLMPQLLGSARVLLFDQHNCSYTLFATCRHNFARGSESTGVVHRIGFLIFFLCVDDMNQQFWARARVSGTDVCFASGAIASRRWDSAVLFCLSVFPTPFFNNDGWGSVLFHFQQVICHRFGRLCSQERLGSPHGDGGGRVATCFVGLFYVLYSVYSLLFALFSLRPLLSLCACGAPPPGGEGGREVYGMVARFLGGCLNWAGPRSGSRGSIV